MPLQVYSKISCDQQVSKFPILTKKVLDTKVSDILVSVLIFFTCNSHHYLSGLHRMESTVCNKNHPMVSGSLAHFACNVPAFGPGFEVWTVLDHISI